MIPKFIKEFIGIRLMVNPWIYLYGRLRVNYQNSRNQYYSAVLAEVSLVCANPHPGGNDERFIINLLSTFELSNSAGTVIRVASLNPRRGMIFTYNYGHRLQWMFSNLFMLLLWKWELRILMQNKVCSCPPTVGSVIYTSLWIKSANLSLIVVSSFSWHLNGMNVIFQYSVCSDIHWRFRTYFILQHIPRFCVSINNLDCYQGIYPVGVN